MDRETQWSALRPLYFQGAPMNNFEGSWIIERTFLRWMIAHPREFTAGGSIAILMILTRMNNSTGMSFPGRETIAKDAGIGIKVAESAIKKAKEIGILFVVRRGMGKTNLYYPGQALIDFHNTEYIKPRHPQNEGITPGDAPEKGAQRHPQNGGTERDKKEVKKDSDQGSLFPDIPIHVSREKKKSSGSEINMENIRALYNQMAVECGIPECRGITGSRAIHVRARIKEHGLEKFSEVITAPLRSRFLSGKSKPQQGYKIFKMTLDWAMNEANFIKILEGKYQDEKSESEGDHHAF